MVVETPALKDCRLMVATPIYGGAQGNYVHSVLGLALAAQAIGLGIDFAFILDQPQIDRSRNMLAHAFLKSDFTHLLFVDADIGFSADDVFSMLDRMASSPDAAIVGAAVPRRSINWANVARAAQLGLSADDPSMLERLSGDFNVALTSNSRTFERDELIELDRLGTGLMLIRRDAIETLTRTHGELNYRPDPVEKLNYQLDDQVCALFQPLIDPQSQHLLSEDYAFCSRARAASFRIWLAPWVRASHSGPATFSGALADLGALSLPSKPS